MLMLGHKVDSIALANPVVPGPVVCNEDVVKCSRPSSCRQCQATKQIDPSKGKLSQGEPGTGVCILDKFSTLQVGFAGSQVG